LKAAGKVRESEPYYTAALEMQQRLVAVAGGGDDAGVPTLMNNVGLVKTDLGERAEGRRWLEESLAMRRRLFLDHHADVVESLINLASWHHDDSDFARTFELESEAVAIMRRLTPGDDMLLAIAIDNLGSTVCDLGRLDDSIALHREALAMERRLVKGDDATVAQTLCELGVTLYLTDRNEEAIVFIAESLHMRRRLYAEGHPRIMDTLVHLGHAQADADEAIPAAESFREVLTTCARAPQDHTRSLVQALKGLARACAASASYAADESTLTTAARGILAERNLPSELRERCRAVMAEYYRGWQAQAPDAATAARAREWAAPR